MEFTFDLRRTLHPNPDGFAVIEPSRTFAASREVCELVDRMGRASSTAQGLKSVITTASRFFASSDNLLFILVEGNAVVGILKTGVRKLFYTDNLGRIKEISPLCVLDFYVHESRQRAGFGKVLYENMLAHLQVSPSQLAIDRPSQKFLSFMGRHYGLKDFIPQNNNFVVYNQYFAPQSRHVPSRARAAEVTEPEPRRRPPREDILAHDPSPYQPPRQSRSPQVPPRREESLVQEPIRPPVYVAPREARQDPELQ
jgi:alpha-tubulin N-acetyltransferase 1